MALNETLQKLASQFNLTPLDLEPEAYILTPEEEQEAIRHAVNAAKDHYKWRMQDKGFSKMEVESKVSRMNWLEKIDIAEVLKACNANKANRIWEAEQRAKEKLEASQQQLELKKDWTASRMVKHLQQVSREAYGKKLLITDDTLPLIKTLCYFLSADARFESELGFDLRKGLLIRGISGLGKTYLVKCLSGNKLNPVSIVSVLTIADEIRLTGRYDIPYAQSVLYLDDVGTETTPIMHYGTPINFFKDFLELYYSNGRAFNQLMISTNNSFQEMEEKYGFRVRSRIKDMFNIVNVQGKDLRG